MRQWILGGFGLLGGAAIFSALLLIGSISSAQQRRDTPSEKSSQPAPREGLQYPTNEQAQERFQQLQKVPKGAAATTANKPATPSTEPATGPTFEQPDTEPTPMLTGTPNPDGKWCDVCISADDPKDIVVMDNQGHYIPEVREINVFIAVGTDKPKVRLKMWKGFYRPATAKQEDWNVRKMSTVSKQEFQRIVDQDAGL